MQVSNDVLMLLSTSTLSDDGCCLTLPGQVDRKLYKATNAVLEALGGAWNRRADAHVFEHDVRKRLEDALASGEVTTAADLGFFETPEGLAIRLVTLAGVLEGDLCLEPSAGGGRIVRELLAEDAQVVAIERDSDRRRRLRLWSESADGALYVDDCDDFMTYAPTDPFDRVVMNPPFLRCGLGDHLDHVRHAYSMLIPGGVLVSVLPHGVRFRQDRRHREFREWVETRGEIEDLPDGSFKRSGTGVRTCVVRLVRA